MTFDEKLKEIESLFNQGNKQMAEAVYTLKIAKEKMSQLKEAPELQFLPKDFLTNILGETNETRN
tara:strand:- start:37019 stop:37213 length:195 start_codon:yes stop_codon:yes gene_type:complete